MEQQELAALVALHDTPGLGQKSLWRLKRHFSAWNTAAQADAAELKAAGLRPAVVEAWIRQRPAPEEQLRRLATLQRDGIMLCCYEEATYPESLKTMYSPPYAFYYRGDLSIIQSSGLAVVGSRNATPYGRKQAENISRDLALAGYTIISGMARGIDTCAHRGALQVEGKTAAVLGSGLYSIYPAENRNLYEEIAEYGIVISDFAVDTRPEPGNFPYRNHIIAGLSRGVFIVEAALKSGALITADAALEQGRDVFALPGPVSSRQSEGCHQLIRQGAVLVGSAEDILQEYVGVSGVAGRISSPPAELTELEQAIIAILSSEAKHIDILLAELGCGFGELSAALMNLEWKGLTGSLPGNYYIKH